MSASKQPNILVIMMDQLSARALRLYGGQTAKTPNLDRLAETGTVFRNAYSNSPLCAPARFLFMAGQLPSRIGAYDNAAEFRSEIPTFAHYLRLQGYQTTLSGKMHFIGADQLHGFESRLTTDIYPADFGWTPDAENPDERFDWWMHNMMSIKQAGIAEYTNQLEYDDETGHRAVQKLYDLARGADRRPFCLVTSFTHPHDPYAARRKHWNRYRESEIEMPTVPAMPFAELDPHSQRLYKAAATEDYDVTEDDIRNARHAYFANIAYLDDWIGELLETLEETGWLDDTAVVLTADHGDMVGERGLWYKMSFFEWSARIPLILRLPGESGGRTVETPVSLVDILPTLVDIAAEGGTHIDYAAPLDGQSLLPLVSRNEDRTVYGEYMGEGTVAPLIMIRRGSYKYVHCEVDPPQLFDLAADPEEKRNLAPDPAHAELVTALDAEIAAGWNLTAIRDQVIASQHRRRLVSRALMTGRYTSWDFEPHQDAANRFMRNHLDLNDVEAKSRFPVPPYPQPLDRSG
ncbi:MAG: choline-sulfatase [Gammaproteobacteria bacterium]|nr:choline-sulfatase [Gammaproteobacteria bacterium]